MATTAESLAIDVKDYDAITDYRLIRQWLLWGAVWVMFAPSLGITISLMFNYPDYLGQSEYFTFGRLRPMHVNGVIFGAFSTLFVGLVYYLLPRLTGTAVYRASWGYPMLWLWNAALILGMFMLLLGYNQGLEAGELPLIPDIMFFAAICVITYQVIMTVATRVVRPMYVSLWYLVAALVWTVANLILGFVIPYTIPGINNAAFHGLFLHYIVGLWITPAGYVLIYYFLPASVKNPIYSHKLSMVGFWSLAVFYPFVGLHHYLYSPFADWAETLAIITSMLLIIPVWTVLQNFFGTMVGRWQSFGQNLTAKFMIMGSIMYLFGCFQGSTEALRSIQQPTHFTDFVISHSHLTVFGTFVVWAIGGLVYVWPRLCARPLWSFKLGNWSFWLITFGISLMGIGLSAQGIQQGYMLMAGSEWVDTVVTMKPYWIVRTIAGSLMDIGISLLVYNLMRTALAPSEATVPAGLTPAAAGRIAS
jgi:cytochrome c oxidase cbb3-type subunit 1